MPDGNFHAGSTPTPFSYGGLDSTGAATVNLSQAF